MNDKDLDLFEGLDEELEGIDLEGTSSTATTTAEITENVEDAEIELNDEEIKQVEATAVEQVGDVGDIDAFIDQYKDKTKEEIKRDKSTKASKKAAATGTAEKKEEKYEGPRKVVVYGNELWIENDPNVTEEQIRQKIVNDYHFPEFAKDRTVFSLDKSTGILVPGIKFEKRG